MFKIFKINSMKRIFFSLIILTLLYSCNDMFDNFKKYVPEEKVYPGMFDMIEGRVGYERVEIDLNTTGRVPAAQMHLGKADSTIIVYDGNVIAIDSVCSWVNITGLTQSRIYQFQIFTADRFGDRSVPREIQLTPYTSEDLAMLSVPVARIISSPWRVQVDWPNGVSSVLLDYYGLSFSYPDKNDVEHEVEREANAGFFVENMEYGEQVLNIRYKIVPKVDEVPILDTLEMERPLTVNIPTIGQYQEKLTNRAVQSMDYSSNGDAIVITWAPLGTDYTLSYTTVSYTDHSVEPPVEREIRTENTQRQTALSGAESGESISIVSTYEPLGGGGTLIDANPTELVLDAEEIPMPVADMMDIVFSQGGNATDISSQHSTVLKGSVAPQTYLNAIYGWTAQFTLNTSTYYRIDYAENTDIKNAFTTAYSLEAFFMNNDNATVTRTPLSSETTNGTGIEIVSRQIMLYVRIGSAWVTVASGVYMEANTYYHAVGTYSKATGKIAIYVNGEKKDEKDVVGNFTLPVVANQWICIGGDPTTAATNICRWPLNGEVSIARMYGKALSAKEISLLYKDVAGE
jgi:hypothetical protein